MKGALLGFLVAAMAGSAHAALIVTSATVRHNDTVVLDSAAPGNDFTTYGGRAGVTVAMGDTSGTVRVDIYSGYNPNGPYPITEVCSGTMRFQAIDGTFTATRPAGPYNSLAGFEFRVTNLATNEYWRKSWLIGSSTDVGTLAFPTSAGDYELAWDTRAYTTRAISAHFDLNFTITPEPSSMLLAGGSALLSRRRVRRT